MALTAGVITIPAAGIVIVTGAIAAPTLAGASTPSGGKVSLWANANLTGATSKIVVVGAIADSGVGTSIDKNGKVDPNGSYERIVLKKGSFEADSTVLDQNASSEQPTLNDVSTCSFAFSDVWAHHPFEWERRVRRHFGHLERHGTVRGDRSALQDREEQGCVQPERQCSPRRGRWSRQRNRYRRFQQLKQRSTWSHRRRAPEFDPPHWVGRPQKSRREFAD